MKKLCFIILFIALSYNNINASIIDKNKYPLNIVVFYDTKIIPFIKDKFKTNISDEYLIVERKLIKIELSRYEVIDNVETIIVHIEFVVRITDRDDNIEYLTIRGQETVFIKDRNNIKEFYPFTEYVIQSDINEIEKLLTKEVL